MSVKSLVAISSVLVAATAFAQAQLGSVASVQGVVTVTDGTTGGTAAAGNPIVDGMRFVATSSGSAVLRLNNGCTIRLQPSHSVTVLKSMTCQELMAAVQSVGGSNFAASGGGSMGTGALASVGLLTGGQALNRSLGRSRSLSSN